MPKPKCAALQARTVSCPSARTGHCQCVRTALSPRTALGLSLWQTLPSTPCVNTSVSQCATQTAAQGGSLSMISCTSLQDTLYATPSATKASIQASTLVLRWDVILVSVSYVRLYLLLHVLQCLHPCTAPCQPQRPTLFAPLCPMWCLRQAPLPHTPPEVEGPRCPTLSLSPPTMR